MTMLTRWRAAGLVLPSVLALLLLPVLLGLGTWQLQRKAWKEQLMAKIETRSKAEPVSYTAALAQFVQTGDVEYLRVRVTGTFDHAEERHLYAPRESGPGWHVTTLFKPDGGFPVFVNRGWVPEALKDPAKRAEGQLAGPVTVTGLVRLPQATSMFTPENDINGNRWYGRDLDAMRWGEAGTPSLDSLAVMRLSAYAPFSIDADALPANPGGWPKGGTTEIRLYNAHLQYVVTWYGIALTLIGVFAAFARQRLSALDSPQIQP